MPAVQPRYINNQTDTLWADVSEFQAPVTDAYTSAGYRWISIRANDGTYLDHHFAQNYRWAVGALNDGRLDGLICYSYWRANWQATAQSLMGQVNANGGPHPKMVTMIDLESGGNPGGDQSAGATGVYNIWANWLGNPRRVIGYGNTYDLGSMWPSRPPGLQLIIAGYGNNPSFPGKFAHQYTDGSGYGAASGLPDGAPPFGNCDFNCSDGMSSLMVADLLGVGGPPAPPPPSDASILAAAPQIASQFDA